MLIVISNKCRPPPHYLYRLPMTTVNWIGIEKSFHLFSISDHLPGINKTVDIDTALSDINEIKKAEINVLVADIENAQKFVDLKHALTKDNIFTIALINEDSLLRNRKNSEKIQLLIEHSFSLFNLNFLLSTLLENEIEAITEPQDQSTNSQISDKHQLEDILFDIFEENNRWYGDLNLTVALNRQLMLASLRSIGFSVPDASWERKFTFISAMVENGVLQIVFEHTECCSLLRQYLGAVCERLGAGRTVNINYSPKTLRDLVSNIDPESFLMTGITVSTISNLNHLRLLIFFKPEY